jgi:DNA-directed RNA polymerase subunit alpha
VSIYPAEQKVKFSPLADEDIPRFVLDAVCSSISPASAVDDKIRIIQRLFRIAAAITQQASDLLDPADPVLRAKLNTKIDELSLSARSRNAFTNDNMICVRDLVQMTEVELLRMPNFGRVSLAEIKAILGQMDLHLGMKLPSWLEPAP